MKQINKQYLLETTREERRSHLLLHTPCIERGGDSRNHKGVLAEALNTTIPTIKESGRILLCHACNNPKCSNPYHLYWGSDRDNVIDAIENGTFMKHKHSKKYLKEIASKGGKNNKGKKKSFEHRKKISETMKNKV